MRSTAGLDSHIKHYTVYKPNKFGEPGVYRRYQAFADAVRAAEVPWSGRGRLPWAQRAAGASFPSRREAEEAYRSEFQLGVEAVVPHWD